MRRGLYFVLMVVLVLRGLTGTAMAAGVLPPAGGHGPAQQLQAHQHSHGAEHPTATDADLQAGALPHEGHGHPSPAQAMHALCDAASTSDCAAHHNHASCAACEICHSAMLDAPVRLALAGAEAGTTLPLASAQFVSAPAALAHKPPIA